jgi:hypothetical protein
MKFRAIGFWISSAGQDFSISRETDSEDPVVVSDMLCKEGRSDKKELSVVVLVKNGENGDAPEVHEFWRGENGDFQ